MTEATISNQYLAISTIYVMYDSFLYRPSLKTWPLGRAKTRRVKGVTRRRVKDSERPALEQLLQEAVRMCHVDTSEAADLVALLATQAHTCLKIDI